MLRSAIYSYRNRRSSRVPIPDFRTVGNEYIGHPSPDLLETIYLCQQRQEWYRDYARSMGETACPFVGAANLTQDVVTVAGRIRQALGFDLDARRRMRTWEEALRQFIEQADEAGVMVMVNGVVGSNNHRKLDPGRVSRLCLVGRTGAPRFHQWLGYEIRPDVHARA